MINRDAAALGANVALPPETNLGAGGGFRGQMVERLRRALHAIVDPDVSICRTAGERGIFCRGFRRWGAADFDRRWRKPIGRSTHLTRDQMEQFADLWQLTEQMRCGVPLACDAANGPGSPCRGWDEFSDEDLARFCSELTGLRFTELPIVERND